MMYFPYLRGKQFELVMLREIVDLVTSNGKIVPIIEPVNINTRALERAVETYAQHNASFVVIANPYVGRLAGQDFSKLDPVIEKMPAVNNSMVGYLVSEKSNSSEIETFVNRYGDYKLVFIHLHPYSDIEEIRSVNQIVYNVFEDGSTNKNYQNAFAKSTRVWLKDAFKSRRRNKDYPPDEFFSDLHTTYKDSGFVGFGDFLIVGDRYFETGGAPHAVAIHLSYLHEDDVIWVKHFLSDRTEGQVDTAGKFLEALEKLISFYRGNKKALNYSSACKEYEDLFKRKHFPQLGFVKKLSMRHHLELMATVIR